MKSRHRKPVDPADESCPKSDHDTVHLDTLAVRTTGRQLATGKLELRHETADRLAIERGEDEGMTVRPGYKPFPGGTHQRGHYAHANAYW